MESTRASLPIVGLRVAAVLSAVAGPVAASAFAWWGSPAVLPLSVAALGCAVSRAPFRHGFLCGAVFGATFGAVTLAWLWSSAGVVAWLAMAFATGAWFSAFGITLAAVSRLPWWPVWGASLWTAMEFAQARWPLGGFGWTRLGYTVVDSSAVDALPLLGIGGTGFVIALAGFSMASRAVSRRGQGATGRGSVEVALMTAALMVPGLLPPLGALSDGSRVQGASVRVGVVQPGVPGDGTDVVAHHREVTQRLARASLDVFGAPASSRSRTPDVIVWPENSTAVDPFSDPIARRTIADVSSRIDAPILLGAMVSDPEFPAERNRNQSLLAVEGTLEPRAAYTKGHPVPFGEYLPWRRFTEKVFPRADEIPRDTVAGEDARPRRVGGVALGLAICFDVAFDDVLPAQVLAGAQVLVVQTSNAFFAGTSQPEQQFAITRARAAETGRSVVVSATNGVSAVIGPDGSVIARSAGRSTEVLVAQVPVRTGLTPAVRWGRWIEALMLLVAACAVIASCRPALRLRSSADTTTRTRQEHDAEPG